MTILKPLSWKIGVFLLCHSEWNEESYHPFKGSGLQQPRILRDKYCGVEDFFLFLFCLRRDTFVQSYKSIQKNSSKNFSVILFVCWFSKQYEESLHPILLDSFSIFLTVISMQSDKWKIFGWRLFWIYFSNNTPYLIIY